MKKLLLLLVVIPFSAFLGQAQTKQPLVLIQTIDLPDVPTFVYAGDLAVDLKGHRLFAAIQATKSVFVIDLNTSKVIKTIPVEYAHSILFMNDLDQIYVSDAGPTQPGVKIFNGRDYQLMKSINLLLRTDTAEYDPATKYFYVVNGGGAVKQDYSLVTVIDTMTQERIGDIKIPAKALEPMAFETESSLMYISMRDKDQVGVADRNKRTFIEAWPITKAKHPSAIALDEKHHRLFVGCRTTDMRGDIVVFDTQTKKEVDALPIGGMVDDVAFDEQSGRIYASAGTGEVDVYQARDPDHYSLLGKADTGIMARSGLLVPELHRFFSSVPCIGTQSAKILVFQVQ